MHYVELLLISTSLFFGLAPVSALSSDTSEELVSFPRQLQVNEDAVYSLAVSASSDSKAYATLRNVQSNKLEDIECAACFFYLHRPYFSGVYRVNKRGEFNVPTDSRLPPFPSAYAVRTAGALLRRAEIRGANFEPVVAESGEGDFLYADPPYSTSGRHKGEYGAKGCDDRDLIRLCRGSRQS